MLFNPFLATHMEGNSFHDMKVFEFNFSYFLKMGCHVWKVVKLVSRNTILLTMHINIAMIVSHGNLTLTRYVLTKYSLRHHHNWAKSPPKQMRHRLHIELGP